MGLSSLTLRAEKSQQQDRDATERSSCESGLVNPLL